MKILNRTQFLDMPAGTLYRKCREPWAFDDIQIKWDSYHGDWTAQDLGEIDALDSGDWLDRLTDMAARPGEVSKPWDRCATARDGCFEKDALFLVFEPHEVEQLIGLLTLAKRHASPEARSAPTGALRPNGAVECPPVSDTGAG